MAFKPGESGNPGGRKKAVGLSRAVRTSEGLKTWGMLLNIRDEKIREQKIEMHDGEPVVVDVLPSIKERREACKLILAYCWGQPSQKIDLTDDDGVNRFAFGIVLDTKAQGILENGKHTESAETGAERIGFDFGGSNGRS
jgi:hypothetical protein